MPQDTDTPLQENLRSEEVTHLISAHPGFWGRWALLCMLAILLLVMGGAWFIQYPETITANGVLTATHLPQKIVDAADGRLTGIFVKDGDTVSANDPIANIETNTGQQLIRASASGKIALALVVAKNRWLPTGEVLGTITPLNNHYYARLYFAQHDLGRVHAGQPVQVRLTAYPYEEFGSLPGRLDYNSIEATDNGFWANVELVNGLTTNANQSVEFHNGLQARALIRTRQMRLLQRFYYNMFRRAGK